MTPNIDGFEYIPPLKLYVAKEKKFYEDNSFDSHKKLKANGERMLTLPEFIEFLKYSKTNLPETYKEITEVRSPWRAEWLDIKFKIKDNKLYAPKDLEILDKNTLMENKQISLEDYLDNNHTSQGLPSKEVKSGDFYYWCPKRDNSIATFRASSEGTILYCGRDPSYGSSFLGVRAVRYD